MEFAKEILGWSIFVAIYVCFCAYTAYKVFGGTGESRKERLERKLDSIERSVNKINRELSNEVSSLKYERKKLERQLERLRDIEYGLKWKS